MRTLGTIILEQRGFYCGEKTIFFMSLLGLIVVNCNVLESGWSVGNEDVGKQSNEDFIVARKLSFLISLLGLIVVNCNVLEIVVGP